MDKVFAISFLFFVCSAGVFSQEINEKVDTKYGFKDIRLEMKADSLLKHIKASLIKGDKYRYALYQILDPKYMKVGDYKISHLTLTVVFNKIYSIDFTAPNEVSAGGIYNALFDLFGQPSFRGDGRNCKWTGNKGLVYFIEDPVQTKADITFKTSVLEADYKMIKDNDSQKTVKDF